MESIYYSKIPYTEKYIFAVVSIVSNLTDNQCGVCTEQYNMLVL